MLRFFKIIMMSLFLSGCFFIYQRINNPIPTIKIKHISTKLYDSETYTMKTVLSSNLDLNRESVEKLVGVTNTNQVFLCSDDKIKIIDGWSNNSDWLEGRVLSSYSSGGVFFYEIVYSSKIGVNVGDEMIFFNKYKPTKLYCQYQIYFWNSTPSISNILEIGNEND